MIDISVKDLVKSFDEDENLLDGISFDVQSGERVGLLGKNGAGKTTLFKILTGEMDYNSGEIAFAQGEKGRPHFADPGLSGRVHGERRAARSVFEPGQDQSAHAAAGEDHDREHAKRSFIGV